MTTVGEFLTDLQVRRCIELYPDIKAIELEVIRPSMPDINRKLGQENDATYLAMAVVCAIAQGTRAHNTR
jgi:hypothetical protein